MMWTRAYWLNVAEQAVTGAAAGVALAIPDIADAHWLNVAGYAAAGALALAAKSVLANFTGKQRNTTMVTAVQPVVGHGWNPVDPLDA